MLRVLVSRDPPYDKKVLVVNFEYDSSDYDEEVQIVRNHPFDMRVKIVRQTRDKERYDLRVRVINPDALPTEHQNNLPCPKCGSEFGLDDGIMRRCGYCGNMFSRQGYLRK